MIVHLEHLIGAWFDSGNKMCRTESRLLNLGEIIFRISIENEFSDLTKRVGLLRPDLREVKGIKRARLSLREGHDLDVPGTIDGFLCSTSALTDTYF